MKYRTPFAWMAVFICIGTSFVFGRISSLETSPVHSALSVAPGLQTTAVGGPKAFLPVVHAVVDASPQPQLATTVTALIGENAYQATQIIGLSNTIRYILTQVPAQNRVPTIDVLVYRHDQLATQVAELYVALGSPVPTTPPSPTFGPTPLSTLTPLVRLQAPTPTPTIP